MTNENLVLGGAAVTLAILLVRCGVKVYLGI